jgi:hypothetical protein
VTSRCHLCLGSSPSRQVGTKDQRIHLAAIRRADREFNPRRASRCGPLAAQQCAGEPPSFGDRGFHLLHAWMGPLGGPH